MSMKCHLSYVRETQRKVQKIVPYAVSENVKEMLNFLQLEMYMKCELSWRFTRISVCKKFNISSSDEVSDNFILYSDIFSILNVQIL